MCIGIIWTNSFLVGGRALDEARIDPRPLRASRSTAHGAQVVLPFNYMGRASYCTEFSQYILCESHQTVDAANAVEASKWHQWSFYDDEQRTLC